LHPIGCDQIHPNKNAIPVRSHTSHKKQQNHRNKSNRYKLHGRKLYSMGRKGETRRGGERVMRSEEGKKWKGSEN
jgi:hypothetical protein